MSEEGRNRRKESIRQQRGNVVVSSVFSTTEHAKCWSFSAFRERAWSFPLSSCCWLMEASGRPFIWASVSRNERARVSALPTRRSNISYGMRHPRSFNIYPHRWCRRRTRCPSPLHSQPSAFHTTTTLTRTTIFFLSFVRFPCITFAYVCPFIRLPVDSISFQFFILFFYYFSFVAVTLSLDKHVDENDSGILLMNWHDFIVCRLAIRSTNTNKVAHLCRCAAAALATTAARKEFSDRRHSSQLKK